MKITGLDELMNRLLTNLGDLEKVYLTGALAEGNKSEIIDPTLVGKVHRVYFSELIAKAEKFIQKKIRFVVFDVDEFADKEAKIISENGLLLWRKL